MQYYTPPMCVTTALVAFLCVLPKKVELLEIHGGLNAIFKESQACLFKVRRDGLPLRNQYRIFLLYVTAIWRPIKRLENKHGNLQAISRNLLGSKEEEVSVCIP